MSEAYPLRRTELDLYEADIGNIYEHFGDIFYQYTVHRLIIRVLFVPLRLMSKFLQMQRNHLPRSFQSRTLVVIYMGGPGFSTKVEKYVTILTLQGIVIAPVDHIGIFARNVNSQVMAK